MVVLEFYSALIVLFSLVTIYALKIFPSLPKVIESDKTPKVSIIVPARNEEDTIEECLESLVALDYPEKEIIVVEGNSTDNTAQIVQKFSQRVKLVEEGSLPEGWIGKNWACHLGYKYSSGELLLFTDGDTIHLKDSLKRSVSFLLQHNLDLVTLYSKFRTRSFWEKLMLPTIIHLIFLYMWGPKVNDDKSPHYMANGQYILARRQPYEGVGGHYGARAQIIEDVTLAENLKKAGFKTRMLYGFDALENKMYANFSELWEGWVKNTFAGFRFSPKFLLEGLAIIICTFLVPFVVTAYGISIVSHSGLNNYLVYGGVMVASLYIGMGIEYRRLADALRYTVLFPVAILLFIAVTLTSYQRVTSGRGVTWKGRTYDLVAKRS